MLTAGEPRSSRRGRLVALLVWTLLLLALWLWGRELTESGLARPVFGDAPAAAAGAVPLGGAPAPTAVEIADIGLRADIVPRGLDEEGGVAAPPFSSPELVGWWEGGPTPGAEGAAVLVGHVDTEREPAVFHALESVEPGAVVRVARADGSVAEFTVGAVELVERDAFDAERVYGPRRTGAAELRLITCGGTFDRESSGYSANVVVSAYLTGRA
ncbi:class F sortase [Streptomyces sp. PT12]|uniref:class F sortase n=1 Tax=Streptomyces sp. PT12 TaxID=1510197 RepID=UPI000DE2B6AE|nr:class F sortase [Streptomyces sp. PT12]RBM21409.1 class F sortase [Streptomyces sp. PT12]